MIENPVSMMEAALEKVCADRELKLSVLIESGAHAFRKRDMHSVKSICLQAVEQTKQVRTVKNVRDEWSAMLALQELLCVSTVHTRSQDLVKNLSCPLKQAIALVDVIIDHLAEIGATEFRSHDFVKVEQVQSHVLSVLRFEMHLADLLPPTEPSTDALQDKEASSCYEEAA